MKNLKSYRQFYTKSNKENIYKTNICFNNNKYCCKTEAELGKINSKYKKKKHLNIVKPS